MMSQPTTQMLQQKLQHNFCSISHKLKANKQRILVSEQNIPREIFFFKNYAENEAVKLVPDRFSFF